MAKFCTACGSKLPTGRRKAPDLEPPDEPPGNAVNESEVYATFGNLDLETVQWRKRVLLFFIGIAIVVIPAAILIYGRPDWGRLLQGLVRSREIRYEILESRSGFITNPSLHVKIYNISLEVSPKHKRVVMGEDEYTNRDFMSVIVRLFESQDVCYDMVVARISYPETTLLAVTRQVAHDMNLLNPDPESTVELTRKTYSCGLSAFQHQKEYIFYLAPYLNRLSIYDLYDVFDR
jgi:hypothetical protein